ncbi:MAG TPA: glycosyltransferase family 4 protein [Pyrinomonadaceae bacterium]|nr:glycosyltransferase family 4 protein [Pyrinomonadaceae bacterium]
MLTVLHISTTDNSGGSGRSAYRVHTGLKELGVGSRMLVGRKVTDDNDVLPIAPDGFNAAADRFFSRALGRLSWQYLFFPSSFRLLRHPWFKEADVVQLYNTHGNYFSHTVLPLLSRRRPVVWRLSDMWPMTGHCAYSFDCERWRTGCGSCPILSDPPELYRDTTATLWKIKNWSYSRSDLTIVAPSKWIAGLAAESPLLGRFPVHIIPNGLDTSVFAPVAKQEARESLQITPSERVVLFSAESLTDRRKGGAYLQAAIKRLAETEQNLTVLMVGGNGSHIDMPVSVRTRVTGRIDDDCALAKIYSAADVFVLPTLAENLPNVALESMACGTPPVIFDVGGCSDAVRHLETGYLARYADGEDLAGGVSLLLNDDELRSRLSRRSREVATSEYGIELQAKRFFSLYQQVTEKVPVNPAIELRDLQDSIDS